MATLEISINCLCVIVPEAEKKTVHVLMPVTSDHHRHLVRALHRGTPKKFPRKGIPLEGWVLRLGKDGASARTDLEPRIAPRHGAEITDLTLLAGTLRRERIDDPEAVVSRIELTGGRVKEVLAEARWKLGGRKIAMAHRVTWEIEDFTPEQVDWDRLGGNGDGAPPFTFDDLKAQGDVIRLDVFHVTEDGLPPQPDGEGNLDEAAVRHHFREFYRLYGITEPKDDQLPGEPEIIEDFFDLVERTTERSNPAAARALARMAERIARATREKGEEISVAEALARIEHLNCPTSTGRIG